MLTYGFYDSLNHDRKYNATQMSSIFDGIILDGIFMTIGNCLRVTADSDMMIFVGTGRAWFNHTWTLNDSILPLQVPQSELLLDRIDAVVLEVNSDQAVRKNSIKIVKGKPSSKPARPTMVNTVSVHQHPLAFISVKKNVTTIRQADITNMVGTSTTPYVTGPLKTINADALLAQWQDQWLRFFEEQSKDMEDTNNFWKQQWATWFKAQTTQIQNSYLNWEKQWNDWYAKQTQDMTQTNEYWKNLWKNWFYDYVNNSTKELAYWKKLVTDDWQDFYNTQRTDMDETNRFWKEEWATWFKAQTTEIQNAYLAWDLQWTNWFNQQTTEMTETNKYWKDLWDAWFYDYTNTSTSEFVGWRENMGQEFVDWWNGLKDLLTGNVDATFANKLLELEMRTEALETFRADLRDDHTIYEYLPSGSEVPPGAIVDEFSGIIKVPVIKFAIIDESYQEMVENVKNLVLQVAELEKFRDDVVNNHEVLAVLTDKVGNNITDNTGTVVEGRRLLVFQ